MHVCPQVTSTTNFCCSKRRPYCPLTIDYSLARQPTLPTTGIAIAFNAWHVYNADSAAPIALMFSPLIPVNFCHITQKSVPWHDHDIPRMLRVPSAIILHDISSKHARKDAFLLYTNGESRRWSPFLWDTIRSTGKQASPIRPTTQQCQPFEAVHAVWHALQACCISPWSLSPHPRIKACNKSPFAKSMALHCLDCWYN